MQLEARKLLEDVRRAADLALRFVADCTFEEYASDEMMMAAVERELEIIGEALNQLSRADRRVFDGITDAPRIVAFRNILIHGYSVVDHGIVWDVLQLHLGPLRQQVECLLAEGNAEPADGD